MDSPKDITLHVCTTCRARGEPLEPRSERAGARLYAALSAARGDGDPPIVPVACFSVCSRPCTISLSGPGRWTYMFGDFPGETTPEAVFAAARLYRKAADGVIPWDERPEALKTGVVARLPPAIETP